MLPSVAQVRCLVYCATLSLLLLVEFDFDLTEFDLEIRNILAARQCTDHRTVILASPVSPSFCLCIRESVWLWHCLVFGCLSTFVLFLSFGFLLSALLSTSLSSSSPPHTTSVGYLVFIPARSVLPSCICTTDVSCRCWREFLSAFSVTSTV